MPSDASPNPGRPTVHRLNRTEYTNSIRDLLALDIDGRSLLPADDTDAHGFDNNADVLTVSPVARRPLSFGGAQDQPPRGRTLDRRRPSKRIRCRASWSRTSVSSERLPFGSRGGTAIEHYFPADGEYVVKIRLQTNNYDYVKGLADPHDLEVRVDRRRIKVFTVGGKKEGAAPASWGGTLYGSTEWEKYALQVHDDLEVRLPVKAGRHELGIAFVRKPWEAGRRAAAAPGRMAAVERRDVRLEPRCRHGDRRGSVRAGRTRATRRPGVGSHVPARRPRKRYGEAGQLRSRRERMTARGRSSRPSRIVPTAGR